MTPVLMTKDLRVERSSAGDSCSSTPLMTWSVFLAIATASSIPPLPVTAFAHPELTMTLWSWKPLELRKICEETWTGAALNMFVVKTAAAAAGVCDVSRARSSYFVFVGFTPACALPTRKPFGYVPVVGMYFNLFGGSPPAGTA